MGGAPGRQLVSLQSFVLFQTKAIPLVLFVESDAELFDFEGILLKKRSDVSYRKTQSRRCIAESFQVLQQIESGVHA